MSISYSLCLGLLCWGVEKFADGLIICIIVPFTRRRIWLRGLKETEITQGVLYLAAKHMASEVGYAYTAYFGLFVSDLVLT